jgi:hypothetical protein
LDWPGATFLTALIKLIIADVKPGLILSIGTAGGAKPQDHIGTVRAVSAGTLFESKKPASSWPEYKNGWTANGATLANASFKQLLFPVPTKASDLETLCSQFNQQYHKTYTLSELDPGGLNLGDPTPQIDNQTGGGASLLTASTFLVGTTAGTYQNYIAIEMDERSSPKPARAAARRSGSCATCRTRRRTRRSNRRSRASGEARSTTSTASTRAIMARSRPGRCWPDFCQAGQRLATSSRTGVSTSRGALRI